MAKKVKSFIEAISDCSQLTIEDVKTNQYRSIESGEWEDFTATEFEISSIVMQLVDETTYKCHAKTKDIVSSKLKTTFGHMPMWSRERFYFELKDGSPHLMYITGQDYYSEMREIRKQIIKGY